MNYRTNQLDTVSVRLDRWLWASRFFKTRALAKSAIEGGKIQLNGNKSKAGKILHYGDMLTIRRGFELYTVEVVGLAEKRGPAKLAQTLYEETEESLVLRNKAAELRRLQRLSETPPSHRPDKRQRRKIHQFKQSRDS